VQCDDQTFYFFLDDLFLSGACVSAEAAKALICLLVRLPGRFNPWAAIDATLLDVFSFLAIRLSPDKHNIGRQKSP
jgi:hypothetical protein